MQTRVGRASAAATSDNLPVQRAGATQRVLIVNGSSDVLEVLEPVLEAGSYDVVFVESSNHAYSQVKRVQPDLVVLCVELDNVEALTVLSMLKLDAETRDIPVITYTSADATEQEQEAAEPEPTMFTSRPALLMN